MAWRREWRLGVLCLPVWSAVFSPPAWAIDYVWNDSGGGPFTASSNWTPSGVPGLADSATFRVGNLPLYPVTFFGPNFSPIDVNINRLFIGTNTLTYGGPQSTLTVANVNITETGRAMILGQTATDNPSVLNCALGELNAFYITIGSAAGSNGTLNITNGSFNSNGFNATHDIIVGLNGSGAFNVSNGADVNIADDTIVAKNAGSMGTISASGAGSLWDSGGDLIIGGLGTGTATVTGSGHVLASGTVTLGQSAGGSGTINMSDAGSQWINQANVIVGAAGIGTVNINNGADMLDGIEVRLGDTAQASGVVNVSGAGSSWNLIDIVSVGHVGEGALNVSSGGVVSSTTTVIGYQGGSTGEILVQGPTSMLQPGGVIVGLSGHGILTILGGAQVNTSQFATVGVSSGSIGIIEVDGANSRLFTGGNVHMDSQGAASLSITNGGEVETANHMYVDDGGEVSLNGGTLDVNGEFRMTGGTFTAQNNADVEVGFGQLQSGAMLHLSSGSIMESLNTGGVFDVEVNATMQVDSGATFETYFARIGTIPGAPANLIVDGPGSLVAAPDCCIDVGYGGTGVLNVTNGGRLETWTGAIGSFDPASIGTVTIDGTDKSGVPSRWVVSAGGPNMGLNATASGTLNIINGGKLQTPGMNLGIPGSATITVSGEDALGNPSTLDGGNLGLAVQPGASADVTASTGGRIQANNISMAANGATATLVLDTESTLEQSGAATITIGNATPGNGSALVDLKNAATFSSGAGGIHINATGQLKLDSGATLTANGPININGGQFAFLGGTLHAQIVNGSLLNQGGTLAPGNSAGTTDISLNYTQQTAGTLQIEIGGVFPGQWDTVTVGGNALLGGTLHVVLIDGFQPVQGNSFTILTTEVGNVGGTFSALNLPAGLSVTYLPTSVRLDVTAMPCPADITNDGQINVSDLLAVINGWGTCPAPPQACPADINDDGAVNVTDLLAIINAWGVCP